MAASRSQEHQDQEYQQALKEQRDSYKKFILDTIKKLLQVKELVYLSLFEPELFAQWLATITPAQKETLRAFSAGLTRIYFDGVLKPDATIRADYSKIHRSFSRLSVSHDVIQVRLDEIVKKSVRLASLETSLKKEHNEQKKILTSHQKLLKRDAPADADGLSLFKDSKKLMNGSVEKQFKLINAALTELSREQSDISGLLLLLEEIKNRINKFSLNYAELTRQTHQIEIDAGARKKFHQYSGAIAQLMGLSSHTIQHLIDKAEGFDDALDSLRRDQITKMTIRLAESRFSDSVDEQESLKLSEEMIINVKMYALLCDEFDLAVYFHERALSLLQSQQNLMSFVKSSPKACRVLAKVYTPQYPAGSTAAIRAAEENDVEMMQLLHRAGVHLMQADRLGRTPVEVAIHHGHVEVLSCLDKLEVDFAKPTVSGKSLQQLITESSSNRKYVMGIVVEEALKRSNPWKKLRYTGIFSENSTKRHDRLQLAAHRITPDSIASAAEESRMSRRVPTCSSSSS